MSSGLSVRGGLSRYLFATLLMLAVFALLLVPHGSSAASSASAGAMSWQNVGTSVDRLFSPLDAPLFGPNVRANSDNTVFGQHEPSLAVSRVHTNTVVVASKDYRNGNVKQVWIDVSTDGGATWPVGRQLQAPGIPSDLPIQSDPVVVARDDGRIYVAVLGTNSAQNRGGVFITWTDDDGATWRNPSVPVFYPENSLDDKEWFDIDNNPASPYYHRMYMMYAPGAGYVTEQHSTDEGVTWSARQQIGVNRTEYTYPVVGSDGTIYNFMMLNWGGGLQGTVQLTKSTNGGATWSTPSTVMTAEQPNSPIRGGDQFRFFSILSAAVDPNNGALYVAWTDSRNLNTNGTDVVYVKSTNGGTTWSAVTRLSHDPVGVVRDHITPVIVVGADSKVHAFWLDRRLDASNHLFDSWYSSSTDGGATWDPDTRVSTVSQDLNVGFPPGSGNAAGDYWGLDTWRDTVYVAWNDTRSGDQDIVVSKGLMNGVVTATPTVAPSATPSNTPIQPSNTVMPLTGTVGQSTATATVMATGTQMPSVTPVSTDTPMSTALVTVIATATICPIEFSDVPSENTFYGSVRCLACRGIVSGYNDGTFKPDNLVTRGQLAKIVSNAGNFQEDPGAQIYQDVPDTQTFYQWINRLSRRGYMGGYTCGSVGEPCVNEDRPYFRPFANATRGQTSKIVSNAKGYNETPIEQTFEDVPTTHPFYEWIQRLGSRGIMGGYNCGGPGEPCGSGSRPYFRPFNNVTRGQSAKIVANTFFPNCQTP